MKIHTTSTLLLTEGVNTEYADETKILQKERGQEKEKQG
jgi:hypothetical protein